jgi:hypothetical protein
MIEANRYYNLNQGSDAILSQLKLGEEGGSVVTRDCGVGSCLGRSAPLPVEQDDGLEGLGFRVIRV